MEKKKPKTAYFCRLCQVWHHPNSAVWESHRAYASERPIPKNGKPPKKSFWDRWGEEKKKPQDITIGIELTIDIPDSEDGKPKVTFNVSGPKKKQA